MPDIDTDPQISFCAVAADVDANGRAVVAWHQFDNATKHHGIAARRYDPKSTSWSAREQVAPTITSGSYSAASVGAAPNGVTVVYWIEHDALDNIFIWATRLEAYVGASAKWSKPVTVWKTKHWYQNQHWPIPSIEFKANGAAMLWWVLGKGPTTDTGVWVADMDSNGKWSAAKQVMDSVDYRALLDNRPNGKMVLGPNNTATLIWHYGADDGDPANDQIRVRRRDANGQWPQSSQVLSMRTLPSTLSIKEYRPGVTVNDKGDILVDWIEMNGTGAIGRELVAKRMSANTGTWGALETIASGVDAYWPEAKIFERSRLDSLNNAEVVWHNYDAQVEQYNLQFATYSATKKKWTVNATLFPITASAENAVHAEVEHDKTGKFYWFQYVHLNSDNNGNYWVSPRVTSINTVLGTAGETVVLGPPASFDSSDQATTMMEPNGRATAVWCDKSKKRIWTSRIE